MLGKVRKLHTGPMISSDSGMGTQGVAVVHQDKAARGHVPGLLDIGPTALWDILALGGRDEISRHVAKLMERQGAVQGVYHNMESF